MVDAETSTIYSSLIVYGIAGLILYILFEYCSAQQEVYYPKVRSKPLRAPDIPRKKIFGWLFSVISVSDDDTLRIAGVDGYVYLRFLRMLAKCFSQCGLIGVIVLCPVYSTCPFNHANPGVSRFTMGNIPSNGHQLWASWLMVWAFTAYFLWNIDREYENFACIRQNYFCSGDRDIQNQVYYSVIVENIPIPYQSNDKLKSFFSEIFPGEVHSAYIPVRFNKLQEAVSQREYVLARLEAAISVYEGTQHKTVPTIKLKYGKASSSCGGTRIAAIPYFEDELAKLNEEVTLYRKKLLSFENTTSTAINEESKPEPGPQTEVQPLKSFCDKADEILCSSTGFVTFTSKITAAIAVQTPVLSHEYPLMRASAAPALSDVLWANVLVPVAYINAFSIATSAALLTGLLFWGLIIAFIAAVSTLSNLATFFPFVKLLDPTSYAFLAGIVPVAVLSIFLALLPLIFAAIAIRLERRKSLSAVQTMVFQW